MISKLNIANTLIDRSILDDTLYPTIQVDESRVGIRMQNLREMSQNIINIIWVDTNNRIETFSLTSST